MRSRANSSMMNRISWSLSGSPSRFLPMSSTMLNKTGGSEVRLRERREPSERVAEMMSGEQLGQEALTRRRARAERLGRGRAEIARLPVTERDARRQRAEVSEDRRPLSARGRSGGGDRSAFAAARRLRNL